MTSPTLRRSDRWKWAQTKPEDNLGLRLLIGIITLLFASLILCLFVRDAHSQTILQTSTDGYIGKVTIVQPPKYHLDRTQWLLLASDGVVRGLDAYSTIRTNQRGYHEVILPDWISKHDGRMYAYSGVVVGANYLLAHELTKHGHRKLAKLATMLDVGFDGEAAIHNLTLSPRKNP